MRQNRKGHSHMDSKEALQVGIDLGTSRSAISASNGEKFVVESYVGWPADMVARKVLKRSVLIGHEALANRTMLDLHRPLERGLLKEGSEKDVEAVRELLKHLLSLVGVKDGEGEKVRAVVGVPAASLRTNKQYLRNAMKGIVNSLMIVSEPFAVAYAILLVDPRRFAMVDPEPGQRLASHRHRAFEQFALGKCEVEPAERN